MAKVLYMRYKTDNKYFILVITFNLGFPIYILGIYAKLF